MGGGPEQDSTQAHPPPQTTPLNNTTHRRPHHLVLRNVSLPVCLEVRLQVLYALFHCGHDLARLGRARVELLQTLLVRLDLAQEAFASLRERGRERRQAGEGERAIMKQRVRMVFEAVLPEHIMHVFLCTTVEWLGSVQSEDKHADEDCSWWWL